jgi:hypothetical protein
MMMLYLQEIIVGSSCSKLNNSQIPKNVMGGSRSVLKPCSRWGDAGRKDAIELLRIQKWKMAARNREGYRKDSGEAMDQKCTRELKEEEEEEEEEEGGRRGSNSSSSSSSIRCLKFFNVHLSVLSFLFHCVASNTRARMLSLWW